jgi:hypothetical protein
MNAKNRAERFEKNPITVQNMENFTNLNDIIQNEVIGRTEDITDTLSLRSHNMQPSPLRDANETNNPSA